MFLLLKKIKNKNLRSIINFFKNALILLLYIFILLEIFIRFFFYTAVESSLKKYIPSKYKASLRQIHLFQAKGYTGGNNFAPICYTDLLFRSHVDEGTCSYPKEKEKDEIRIMCIGDSVTFGSGNYYETYPYILEQRLRKYYPDKKINVLNAGIPGAGSRQIKRTFQFHLVQYQPDILIIRVGGELTDTYEGPTQRNSLYYNIWRILLHSKIFRIVCATIDQIQKPKIPTANQFYDHLTKSSSPSQISSKNLHSTAAIIQDIAHSHGTPYVLTVDYLFRNRENNDIINDRAHHELNELNYFINTIVRFKKKLKNRPVEDLFLDNCHLTTEGNTILAEEIFKVIANKA